MSKKRKSSGGGGVQKKRGRRRGFGGGSKGQLISSVKEAAVAIGGGLVAGMVANKLPIQNAKLKAISPALAGAAMLLTIGRKNPLVRQLATGMLVLGGVSAIRSAFPNVPLLAGEEEIALNPEMLGYNGYNQLEYGSEPIYGSEQIGMGEEGFVTAANM